MGSGIKRLLGITWDYATPTDRACGMAVIFIGLLAAIFWFKQDSALLDYKAIWCVVATLLYFIAIVPPVKRMAGRQHILLLYVAVWGIISLIVGLVSFYATYFSLVEDTAQWDKILNLPPVFAAVMGAAIGWY